MYCQTREPLVACHPCTPLAELPCGRRKTWTLTRLAARLTLASRIVAVSTEGMADDEEMDVEKDSKEGPRFVVKKWCGAPHRPCCVGSLWWQQQPGLRLGV